MITIKTQAKERSTIVFVIDFSDEDGKAVAPVTMAWSLTDRTGAVINGRDQVPVLPTAASSAVVLSGDDLQILDTEAGHRFVARRFVVEAAYDSDLGSNLPVNEVVDFTIENLDKVT